MCGVVFSVRCGIYIAVRFVLVLTWASGLVSVHYTVLLIGMILYACRYTKTNYGTLNVYVCVLCVVCVCVCMCMCGVCVMCVVCVCMCVCCE